MLTGLLLLATAVQAGLPPVQQPAGQPFDSFEVEVAPGALATTLIAVPAQVGIERGEFRVTVDEGVRLYGPAEGSLAWQDGEPAVIVVTFAVPRSALAGLRNAARLRVEWPGGEWHGVIAARVLARHAIVASFGAASQSIERGRERALSVRLENRGNVTDTVSATLQLPAHWTLVEPVAAVVLAPGESFDGAGRIRAPQDGPIGETQAIGLLVRGATAPAVTTLRVVAGSNAADGWVTLPGTAFVGTSDLAAARGGVAALDLGVSFAGSPAPGTDVSFAWRHFGSAWSSRAVRRELAGPSLRAELRRPGAELVAGDVASAGSPLTGGFVQGIGGTAALQLGAVRAELLAGRPGFSDGGVLPGHLGSLRLSAPLGRGTAQLAIADLDRPADPLAPGRARSVVTGYRFVPSARQELSLEVGATHVEAPDADALAAPSAQAGYRFTAPAINVELRARTIAAALPGSAAGHELSASGSGRVGNAFTLGVHSLASRTRTRAGDELTFSLSSVSLRHGSRGVQSHLTTSASQSSGGSGLFADAEQVAAAAGVFVPFGTLHVEASGQIAHARTRLDGGLGTYATVRAGWAAGGSWIAVAGVRQTNLLGTHTRQLDLSGAHVVGGWHIEGGAGADLDAARWAERGHGWLSVSRQLDSGTRLVLGLDHQPLRMGTSPLRISAGVRRSITAPLPLRPQPAAYGIVFEDLDGNGRRDAGEPGIDGVTIRRGTTTTTTDAAGRFAFYEDVLASPQIDSRSIGPGLVQPADAAPGGRGRSEIGLIRTAELRVELVLDAAVSPATPTEAPATEGLAVTLRHDAGEERSAYSDANGSVNFASLPPGRYTLTVHPPDGAGTARAANTPEPVVIELVLEPGESRALEVVAPHRPREIRFRTATRGG